MISFTQIGKLSWRLKPLTVRSKAVVFSLFIPSISLWLLATGSYLVLFSLVPSPGVCSVLSSFVITSLWGEAYIRSAWF